MADDGIISLDEVRKRLQQTHELVKRGPLEKGPMGPQDGGMDPEIAVLKHRANESDRRMERIEGKIDAITITLVQLPTRSALWGMIATVIGISFAVVALFIGILTYLQDQRIAGLTQISPAPVSIAPKLESLPSPASVPVRPIVQPEPAPAK